MGRYGKVELPETGGKGRWKKGLKQGWHKILSLWTKSDHFLPYFLSGLERRGRWVEGALVVKG